MATSTTPSSDTALRNIDGVLPDLEALYKDLHSNPELSMQETRTARVAADRLRAAGHEVATAVGKTGVVGLLKNGDGPTVMLRGHDMHVTWLVAATRLLADARSTCAAR
jgi:metal-dependent amidase/aminoacylase/carboxypeptidase family protein